MASAEQLRVMRGAGGAQAVVRSCAAPRARGSLPRRRAPQGPIKRGS